MRLSRPAHDLYSEFFQDCEFCNSFDFPKVEVYTRSGSWLITNLFMVDGITLGRHVFINPRLVSRDRDNVLRTSKVLMAHELVHVLQYQREGFWKFLAAYIGNFWMIFRKKQKWSLRTWFDSYLEIPHEIEAREVTLEFSAWLRKSRR